MDHSHEGHCRTVDGVMKHFEGAFGGQFPTLPSLSVEADSFAKSSISGSAKGCGFWDRGGFDWFCRCHPCDEQLQLCMPDGKPLANLRYKVHLKNGEVKTGRTDNAGRTKRFKTEQRTEVERVEVFSSKPAPTCCPLHPRADTQLTIELSGAGISTSPTDYGSSQAQVTAPDTSRGLTPGELTMCKLVFKDSIDYAKVRIHNGEFLPFDLQFDDTVVAPFGEIYFPHALFKEDFSTADHDDQVLFIHEMTHVWQYQLGYPVFWRRILMFGITYEYTLTPESLLSDYNMEAQGEILGHYYLHKYLLYTNISPSMGSYRSAVGPYERVLRLFLKDPSDTRNLP